MANLGATYLYTETRLNLDESHVGSTIELTLNALNPKRTVVGPSNAVDEASFSRENLANDASIFLRRSNRSLRSFLWRLLDDRKLLELQCVDLTQELGEEKESIVTLRLRFEKSVRPYCIAFADHDEKDALIIYAITSNDELHTITLGSDCFIHLKTTEALPTDWYRVSQPGSFRVKVPFRMTGIKAAQLFVSMSEGSLLKLDQTEHASWKETYYSASSWNVLPRALAKLKGASFVRFGDTELDASTIVSVAMSPDEENIVTVCLNHTLRIWNAHTGKVVMQADLLVSDETKVQQSKYLVSATQRQLLQVLDIPGRDGDKYYIATFSPKQQSFTFWAVLDAESGVEGVRRIQTDFQFIPPVDRLMQTSAWTMEEFYISANRGWSQTHLWLRARSGPVSRVFKVGFGLFDSDDDLSAAWDSEWVAVNPGQQAIENLNRLAPSEVQVGDINLHCPNISEQWLDFLFHPGRFTNSTLQTAILVYIRGASSSSIRASSSLGSASLKELLSNAISRKAAFHHMGANHDQRELKTSEEWQIFYGLVQDLHKRRSTVISFIFDSEDRLPWVVAADSVSPVRDCTDLDISTFHRIVDRSDLAEEQVLKHFKASYETLDLLQVADMFGSIFTPTFLSNFNRALVSELLSDPSESVQKRISDLYTQTELGINVGSEEWSRVEEAMEEAGGVDVLDYQNFSSILEQLEQDNIGKQVQDRLVRYGTKALIRTTQENLSLHKSILTNLLLLVVFTQIEIYPDNLDADMQNPWRGEDIFVEILAKLKELAVLEFLLKNTRIDQVVKARRHSIGETPVAIRTSNAGAKATPFSVTLLESLFIGDWSKLHVPGNLELPGLLTYLSARWIADLHLGSELEDLTAYVLADLIKHGDECLASAFLPYVPSTGWSTYLRGRLSLLTGEHGDAAAYFNQAAYSISRLSTKDLASLNSASLLRPDERTQLTGGLVGYYEHIMNLFDDIKSYGFVVEFAQTALQYQSLETAAVLQSKKTPRKSGHSDLPPSSSANLLSRLFTAALDSTQYDVAYSALVRLPDALRKACLQKFIDTLIRTRQPTRLLSYPFATLSAELDAELAQKAKSAPSSVAAKGTASYHRILYALRIQSGNFRGAAQCLWDYVAALKSVKGVAVLDPRDERLNEGYLMLINALACCGQDDAWVLDESAAIDGKKRRVVFLDQVRKEYQALLDQASELEEGKYAFVDDGMDVDILQ